MLWQFYFAPPGQDEAEFNIATTRKIYHYIFHRVGNETVTLPFGEVDARDLAAHRPATVASKRRSGWRPRCTTWRSRCGCPTTRATVEALLDSIHVDETIAQQ